MFLLQPYYNNFSKRLIKSPKLYFYDTGLACSLLKITDATQVTDHYLRGGLFESLIISDIIKNRYNVGKDPDVYFWRDSQGHEVDCLLEDAGQLIPLEIKAGYTVSSQFFDGLQTWNKISQTAPENNFVIYAGNEMQKRSYGTVVGWNSLMQELPLLKIES